MCQNKKPPTVYRRSRGRSCRSSGVAPCGDCGATRHSIALRFQVLCLGHQQWHIELVRSATQRTVVMKEKLCIASSHHPKHVLLHPGISNIQLLKYAIPNAIAMQSNHLKPTYVFYAPATASPPALAVNISTIPCTLHAI